MAKIDFSNVDASSLGDFTKRLMLKHLENPKVFNAEFVLSTLVNECFKQEIKKIRG